MYKNKIIVALLGLASIISLSCSNVAQTRFSYMQNATNGASSLNSLLVRDTNNQLAMPEQVIIDDAKSSDSITITWSEVENAKYYTIERAIVDPSDATISATIDESQFKMLKSFINTTSYTDNVLQNAKFTSEAYHSHYKYYYRVYAENPEDNFLMSEPTSMNNYGTLFEPVTKVSADMGVSSDNITVTWSKPEKNVSTYSILRKKEGSSDNFTQVASVKSNVQQYDNAIGESEQGVKFIYKIVANTSTGAQSVDSPEAVGYTLKGDAPSAPQNLAVSRGKSDIEISWSASSFNAEKSKDGKLFYTIYYSTNKDSSKITAKTVDSVHSTSNPYHFTGAKSGLYYFFYVVPFYKDNNDADVIGGMTNSNYENIMENNVGFVISAPSNISVTKGNGKTIRFESAIGNADEKAQYTYNIYGATKQEGMATSPVIASVNGSTEKNGVIEVQISDENEFYAITTNYNGAESAKSAIVSPAPNAAENCSASRANVNPYYAKSANLNGVYPVKITWEKPKNDEPKSYDVYRSTKANSGFKKINEEPITALEYVDENTSAKTQTIFYYKVMSLNTLGQGANYSNVAYGYGALTPTQFFREYNKTVLASQKKLTYMHKKNDLDKLGQENVKGALAGDLDYNARVVGLGAEITMKYTNYAEFAIKYTENGAEESMYVFFLNGNTDTTSNMSANGNMHGTNTATNCMYPGSIVYDKIQIVSGVDQGGIYTSTPQGYTGKESTEVSYLIGKEGK